VEAAAPLWRLAPLVAIVFFGFLAIGLPLPALPKHVHDVLGYGPVVVGWAVGLQSLATVMTRPIGGAVVDARGPKTSVLLGLPCAVAAGVTYLISAFTVATPGVSLTVLMLGRLLLGLGESLFLTGTLTWGMSRVGAQHTGRVMAWQGIAMYAALGLGAPVGLALQRAFGFAGVGAATVALPLVALLIAVGLPGPPRVAAARARGSFLKVIGVIWPQGLALALGTAPYAAMAAFIALHFEARGWGGAGVALLCFAAGYIGVRLFFGHLPDRMGGSRVAVASLAVEAVGQFVLWAAPSQGVAILGALISGLGFSLVFPSFGVQAMRKAPPEVRGLAVGGFMAFFDVALGVTAPVVGVAAASFGFGSVFLVGAVSAAAAALFALATSRARSG
jgi:MFS family permease